jgi:hypothetical protein
VKGTCDRRMVGGRGYITQVRIRYGWKKVVSGSLGESGDYVERGFMEVGVGARRIRASSERYGDGRDGRGRQVRVASWLVRRGCLGESGNARLQSKIHLFGTSDIVWRR